MAVDVIVARKNNSDPDSGGSSSGGISGQVLEAGAISSLSSISQQPAMLSNLAYSNTVVNVNLSMQNAVANQQAMNELGVAILGKTVSRLTTLGPLESKSASEILTGNAVAEPLADLKASLSAFSPAKRKPLPQHVPQPLGPGVFHANAPVYLKTALPSQKLDILDVQGKGS